MLRVARFLFLLVSILFFLFWVAKTQLITWDPTDCPGPLMVADPHSVKSMYNFCGLATERSRKEET